MVLVICCNQRAIRKTGVDSEVDNCRSTDCAFSIDIIRHRSAQVHDIRNFHASARNGLVDDFLIERKRLWTLRGVNSGLQLERCNNGVRGGGNDQILEFEVMDLCWRIVRDISSEEAGAQKYRDSALNIKATSYEAVGTIESESSTRSLSSETALRCRRSLVAYLTSL